MKPSLVRIVEIVAGGVFVYAGVSKAIDPALFAQSIDNYRLLPAIPGALLALYLPWLEMIAGAALLGGWAKRGALIVLLSLAMAFLAVVGSAWIRGLDIRCGCFGPGDASLGLAFVRNVALLALLLALCRTRSATDAKAGSSLISRR